MNQIRKGPYEANVAAGNRRTVSIREEGSPFIPGLRKYFMGYAPLGLVEVLQQLIDHAYLSFRQFRPEAPRSLPQGANGIPDHIITSCQFYKT